MRNAWFLSGGGVDNETAMLGDGADTGAFFAGVFLGGV